MSIIQHKRSSIAGHVPSSLLTGELAINEADSDLYYLDNNVVTAKGLIEPRRLIARGSVSNVANFTIDLTAANIGIYSGFDIYLSEVQAATSGTTFRMRVGDAGGIKSGSSDYRYSTRNSSTDQAADIYFSDLNIASSAWAFFQHWGVGATSDGAAYGGLFIINLSTNDPAYSASYNTRITGLAGWNASDETPSIYILGGETAAALTLTQCQFLCASGNIVRCKYAVVGVQ